MIPLREVLFLEFLHFNVVLQYRTRVFSTFMFRHRSMRLDLDESFPLSLSLFWLDRQTALEQGFVRFIPFFNFCKVLDNIFLAGWA
jgi:hypothetical protein